MSCYQLNLTVSIRIVADCGLQTCQATQKLKQAKTFYFTTISAIIFIHCCAFVVRHALPQGTKINKCSLKW